MVASNHRPELDATPVAPSGEPAYSASPARRVAGAAVRVGVAGSAIAAGQVALGERNPDAILARAAVGALIAEAASLALHYGAAVTAGPEPAHDWVRASYGRARTIYPSAGWVSQSYRRTP